MREPRAPMLYTWGSEAQRVLSVFFRLYTYVRAETGSDSPLESTQRGLHFKMQVEFTNPPVEAAQASRDRSC